MIRGQGLMLRSILLSAAPGEGKEEDENICKINCRTTRSLHSSHFPFLSSPLTKAHRQPPGTVSLMLTLTDPVHPLINLSFLIRIPSSPLANPRVHRPVPAYPRYSCYNVIDFEDTPRMGVLAMVIWPQNFDVNTGTKG